MTGSATTLAHRFAQWWTAIDRYGYILLQPYDLNTSAGTLWLRAQRPLLHGGPSTTISIRDIWTAGTYPFRPLPILDGYHLHGCSWHAQIGGPGDKHAERFDIDLNKDPTLICHRHPHGQDNAIREPVAPYTPEAWMAHIETIVSRLYLEIQDGND
jgi:hypothetical protein